MNATLVLGATEKKDRYANMAIRSLLNHGIQVIAHGKATGNVEGIPIETDWNPNWKVDTVTLYLNPKNQESYYRSIIDLKPKRVIFNPGTENSDFSTLLSEANIESEIACTLVLLSTNQY